MQIQPYLTFNGDCEEAFKSYEKILGGRIENMTTHEGSPMADQTPPEWRKKIMHARLIVGDNVLMGSDHPSKQREEIKGFSLALNIDEPKEAERVFHALAESGKVIMPLQKTFWAPHFGMLVDRFGVPWMVNCEKDS